MSPDASLPTPEQDAAVTPVMGSSLRRQVLVCTAKSCTANGSEAVLEAFKGNQFDIQQRIVETENRINFLVGRYPQLVPRAPRTARA